MAIDNKTLGMILALGGGGNGGGGGSLIPVPAVADIGKVITVVSDGDEGVEYGLNTSVKRVNVTVSGTTVTFPDGETADDIFNAIIGGQNINLVKSGKIYNCINAFSSGNNVIMGFVNLSPTTSGLLFEKISHSPNGWEYSYGIIPPF